jgi:hypothetical protein
VTQVIDHETGVSGPSFFLCVSASLAEAGAKRVQHSRQRKCERRPAAARAHPRGELGLEGVQRFIAESVPV